VRLSQLWIVKNRIHQIIHTSAAPIAELDSPNA
jgi:hypothetical protein